MADRGCAKISIPSNKEEFQCKLKLVSCMPDYSSDLFSVSQCTQWGHSSNLETKKSCMKLQIGTRVKLTQEKSLFYLNCGLLEIKMGSNSVKIHRARKWRRQLANLDQADKVQSALETVGELDDAWIVCALAETTKSTVPRVAETQANEKLERVFTDVMGSLRVESLSVFRF